MPYGSGAQAFGSTGRRSGTEPVHGPDWALQCPCLALHALIRPCTILTSPAYLNWALYCLHLALYTQIKPHADSAQPHAWELGLIPPCAFGSVLHIQIGPMLPCAPDLVHRAMLYSPQSFPQSRKFCSMEVSINAATASPPPNFWTHGKPGGLGDMATGVVSGLWAGGRAISVTVKSYFLVPLFWVSFCLSCSLILHTQSFETAKGNMGERNKEQIPQNLRNLLL